MAQRRGNPRPVFTADALFGGRLLLRQPRVGYRFSADAPLLIWRACQAPDRAVPKAVDLGAGCGVIGLGLLLAEAAERVVAVEIQPRLAALCAKNAAENGLADRFEVIAGDMRIAHPALTPRSFDLVTTNPPFWTADSGHLPREEERRVACHEAKVDLDGWVGVAAGLLEPRRGRLCAVFPARRLQELLVALARVGLGAVSVVAVHPTPRAAAEVVLVEARRGADRPVALEPPLFLRDGRNCETEEARSVYDGAFSAQITRRPDRRSAS
jgi:tRNA1(Val) A37 N6-methylase TrmN6